MNQEASAPRIPVRGSLRLSIATSSPNITAGADFSIFVTIQNPFDVPITLRRTQTHIPIELIDVIGERLRVAGAKKVGHATWSTKLFDGMRSWLDSRRTHAGIAIAVGTDFDPEAGRDLMNIRLDVSQIAEGGTAVGMQFVFPENPPAEELDRIFSRLVDYRKGLMPVTLQPGDSVVRQFVLRTRRWLFFTPLSHSFQIQVDYAMDSVDHADTVAHAQSIRASFSATILGAAAGAVVGTFVRDLGSNNAVDVLSLLRAGVVSILAAVAVVVAFARRSGAQPIASVEDFWGGALIGFTTGFFGFEKFASLFDTGG